MKKTVILMALLMLAVLAHAYDWNTYGYSGIYGQTYTNPYNTSKPSSQSNNPNYLYQPKSYSTPSYTKPYKDYWGNSYRYQENLWKDTDHDGVINYYDYNDRNPKVQTKSQSRLYKQYKW